MKPEDISMQIQRQAVAVPGLVLALMLAQFHWTTAADRGSTDLSPPPDFAGRASAPDSLLALSYRRPATAAAAPQWTRFTDLPVRRSWPLTW